MSVHQTAAGPIEMPREGSGPDQAILLHAAASGPRALFKLASALGQAGWSTAAPALQGYGGTLLRDAGPDDPFAAHVRIARWAFDELGKDAGPGRRVLIGHSMGGLVALLAALDGVAADALVLYEPIVLGCLDPNSPEDIAARAWDGACIQTLHERVAAGNPEAGVAAFVEAYNEVAWSQLPAALRASLVAKASNLVAETIATQDLRLDTAMLAALRMPVLILQGSQSPEVTHRMTAGLARAMPHAVMKIVEGAGHMGPVMSHAPVAAEIKSFLDGLKTVPRAPFPSSPPSSPP
jgi:pimeloyl-ACP methyl ester carboxylesterase